MAVISGGTISPGTLGPFSHDGTPDSTTLAGVAAKGALLIDTSNGLLYQNTGTQETPTWTLVGDQTSA